MRESGLDRANRGSGKLGLVVESELSGSVASEDQQAAFLWERQRMVPITEQGAHSFQRGDQSGLGLIGSVARPQLPRITQSQTPERIPTLSFSLFQAHLLYS